MPFRPSAALLVLAAVLTVSPVQAYCITHSLDPAQSQCQCLELGKPAAWHTSELSYGFNEAAFPGLPDEQLRATVAASFETWQSVTCDGKSIGFHITELPGTTTLQEGPGADEPNENVITHYDAAGWEDKLYSPLAFAITAVWLDKKTGQIYGADIGLNGGMDRFGDCLTQSCCLIACKSDSLKTDLQNVLTHEIGHFLGLSHSDTDPRATMSCTASAGDVDKRTLEPDDIAGICAAYPTSSAFPDDEPKLPDGGTKSGGSHHHGCSLARGGRSTTLDLSVLGLLSALLVLRRRNKLRAA
ncbi:MAG: hypothetical protein JWN04_2351 [Myxococcaceae bacterium]|nr:hypothetical protein [Myxococcaceae bacterium]